MTFKTPDDPPLVTCAFWCVVVGGLLGFLVILFAKW